ncbi:TRPT1 [Mytilus coruscus]|uniref:2'-phosphotransferase n=1 Tax=Mytilus coruscus TaxID=42192 RepID=A0A6J8EE37_MYTCO|nr:TRPT1 [Mytilus coruscus]
MDQPSGQKAYEPQEGGPCSGGGNRNQRGYGRGSGEYRQNKKGNQWNNNYRQDNRQFNQEKRPRGGGFGRPHNYQGPNVYHQVDKTEAQSHNNFNDKARPKDKNYDDHMRGSSPDRQDRSRPKDKNDEDHTRDPSPDRSLPEHCIQETFNSSTNAATQDQLQQVQSTSASGSQGIDINQQGLDNQNMEWNAQQGQGKVFYSKNREQDSRPQYNNRGRGQQQQGYNEKSDNSQHQRYYKNRDHYHNQDRGQQHQRYDDRRDGHGRGQRYQGYYDNNDSYQQGQGYNRSGYQQNDDRRQQRSWGEKSDIQLSKALSFILRHGAERQGYKMMPGGFLYVDEILKRQNNLRDYNLDDVRRIVETNDKKRFHMEPDKETGKMKIRANQGHSIEVEDLELKPLLSANEVSMVIHGTYYASWEKIKHTGLSRMGRNHIHFAAGEPGENGVISGMRQSCEVMIFINLETALADGFKFFRSANNVILCAGNEDGVIPPKYFVEAVQRNPRQRLEFDKTVKVAKVPIGGASLVQEGKGKKKKNKKSKGDREKEDGTETQKKKDKTEVDETALEDTAQMFDEKMEVDASGSKALGVDDSSGSGAMDVTETKGSGALDNIKQAYQNTLDNGEDEEKFEDAVQDQEPEDKYEDAKGAPDSSDVHVESYDEIITINENETSISAVDYLMEKEVVAVHVEPLEDGFRRITCVTEDKSYIFELENNPYLMTSGKVAEFFNLNREPTKVFHGLDSKTCALFFDKYDISLNGTKIFDLKMAYDLMSKKGLGNITDLKKTGFISDCIPADTDVTANCLTYLEAYKYLSRELDKEMRDYKKQLFEMVTEDIDKDKLKELKERKKKELKAASKSDSKAPNKPQSSNKGQQSKSKNKKKSG